MLGAVEVEGLARRSLEIDDKPEEVCVESAPRLPCREFIPLLYENCYCHCDCYCGCGCVTVLAHKLTWTLSTNLVTATTTTTTTITSPSL
jgi:hypothetical protein